MTQTTESAPFKRGDYLVDEATRQTVPPEPGWVGRVQQVLGGPPLRYVLVTPTGYAWRARPEHVRAGTAEERADYDAAAERRRRELRELGRRLAGSRRA
ncbi:hypothetical protein [Streptomyces sp. WMMB303]|uniref:hypothetical protein n=1 Tax=Streptomyces sp. WMMB303 TaxID=3034154 RepID=UPI0023EA9F07|nr:hypothetical protein [Streptomyces sp. WMMB303]MDF4249477.1 hypothetical protein [Streptomyces sp. WMMB303]